MVVGMVFFNLLKSVVVEEENAGQDVVAPKTNVGRYPNVGRSTRGRPSIYDPRNLTQVTKYALLGLNDDEIANLFGVSHMTFQRWKKDVDGFLLALDDGRDKADAEIAHSLYHRAKGYSHDAVKIFLPAANIVNPEPEPVIVNYIEHYPPDTAAARIWMYNRRRGAKGTQWTEVVQNQITGKDGGPLEVNMTTIRRVIVDPKSSPEEK